MDACIVLRIAIVKAAPCMQAGGDIVTDSQTVNKSRALFSAAEEAARFARAAKKGQ
jgi:anthranilate synthase component 1